jgi:4-diphosphocytidyl-2-C-methyl-D-erythritol kinase
MHAIELHDTVTLTPADELTLTCDVDLGIAPQSNLAFKAAQAFSEAFGLDVLIDIDVRKVVPSGAGLGGGSADAAAVLAGLAHWASLDLADKRLLRVAASLGADVPFLLVGGAANMAGRGDEMRHRLKPISAPLVIIKPDVSVSTAAAYAAFDANPPATGDLRPICDALRFQDVGGLVAGMANNMTAASSSLAPQISDVLAWVRERDGVRGSLMAGSGSSVFAIVDNDATAERIAEAAAEQGWWAAATALSPHGAVVREVELGDA